jgi:hypothetical protein
MAGKLRSYDHLMGSLLYFRSIASFLDTGEYIVGVAHSRHRHVIHITVTLDDREIMQVAIRKVRLCASARISNLN